MEQYLFIDSTYVKIKTMRSITNNTSYICKNKDNEIITNNTSCYSCKGT